MVDKERDDHIKVNGVPLSVRIDQDTRTEIEKVRQLEVSEKTHRVHQVSRALPLRRAQRNALPRAAYEENVRRIRKALEQYTSGLTYKQIQEATGTVFDIQTISKVCKTLGARKFRKTFQGAIHVGYKVPDGLKAYAGGRTRTKAPAYGAGELVATIKARLRELEALVEALEKKVAKS